MNEQYKRSSGAVFWKDARNAVQRTRPQRETADGESAAKNAARSNSKLSSVLLKDAVPYILEAVFLKAGLLAGESLRSPVISRSHVM